MDRRELELEIREQAAKADEVKQGLKEFGEQVVDYWRSVSPVQTGRYAATVRVIKRFRMNGFPAIKVGSTSNRAHFIEFGTGTDTTGKEPRYIPRLGVQVMKDTPTPAFAPRAKTVAHFGGNESPISEETDDLGD